MDYTLAEYRIAKKLATEMLKDGVEDIALNEDERRFCELILYSALTQINRSINYKRSLVPKKDNNSDLED